MIKSEIHNDTGIIENAIKRAEVLLDYGVEAGDVFARLVKSGLKGFEAHNAIQAARILSPWR